MRAIWGFHDISEHDFYISIKDKCSFFPLTSGHDRKQSPIFSDYLWLLRWNQTSSGTFLMWSKIVPNHQEFLRMWLVIAPDCLEFLWSTCTVMLITFIRTRDFKNQNKHTQIDIVKKLPANYSKHIFKKKSKAKLISLSMLLKSFLFDKFTIILKSGWHLQHFVSI